MTSERRYGRRAFLAAIGATATLSCLGESPVVSSPSPASTVAVTPGTPPPPTVTGDLAIYTPLDDAVTRELLAGFAKSYPAVKAQILALAAIDELDTRVRVEKDHRKADVIVGGASAYHDALGADGFLTPFVAASSAQIPASLKAPSGLWTGWYEDVLGLVTNKDRLTRELRAKTPSWDDLLDPAWAGKLIVPDPTRTDAGYVLIAAQFFRFARDDAKTVDYIKRLHANVSRYVDDPAQVVALVARGEATAAPAWGHDVLADAVRASSLELLAADDAVLEVGAVSIQNGTRSAAAAHALVEWLCGRDAQTVIAKTGGRYPSRALASAPSGSPSIARLDPKKLDRRAAGDVRDRLLARWREAVGRARGWARPAGPAA